MSGIQTKSSISEQSNDFEVVSYEKLVCKAENLFDNFNGKSSKYHELLSSEYHSILSIDYHSMLPGEYASISSSKYRGILSSAYSDVLSTSYHCISSYERLDMSTTVLPDLTRSINSLTDVFADCEKIYCSTKTKNYFTYFTATDQFFDISKILVRSNTYNNGEEAISISLSSGHKKNADCGHYCQVNSDSFTPGYLSAKSIRRNCGDYCDNYDFFLSTKYDRCWQVNGDDNLSTEIVANENQSINFEINSESLSSEI